MACRGIVTNHFFGRVVLLRMNASNLIFIFDYPQTSITHPCEICFHRVGSLSMTRVIYLSEPLCLK
jgi:hypothetical protein